MSTVQYDVVLEVEEVEGAAAGGRGREAGETEGPERPERPERPAAQGEAEGGRAGGEHRGAQVGGWAGGRCPAGLWAGVASTAGEGVRVVLSFAEPKTGAGWEPHPSHCTCECCRSCGFCGKVFSTVGSRKRHERDKHVEPGSLPCELCGKWCKNRGALIKHKSMLHRPLLAADIRYEAHPALLLAAHHSSLHHHSSALTPAALAASAPGVAAGGRNAPSPPPPLPPPPLTSASLSGVAAGEGEGGSPVGGEAQRAFQQFM
ncbi:zinc finger protein 865-like [Penaeus japonicus]|uniref:zinc finger protein 865-like n=1 Tax=Penaeus japonicus TaxID=27405 RepID=UPI001C714E0D|nr:zinc finger protein 865-like [Penaeus japonicus]